MELKKLFTLQLLSLLLFACSVNDNCIHVEIQGFENNSVDFSDCADFVDTIPLYVNDGHMVAEIRQICLNDTNLFVLDGMKQISKFSLNTGNLIAQIRNMGHSQGEYVDVMSMSIRDNRLYLLDQQSKKVLEYDLNLNFKSSANIDMLPFDMVATDNGFLFSRMDANEGQERILVADFSGKVVMKKLPAKKATENIPTTKAFNGGYRCQLSIHEPASSDIYSWQDNDVTLKYRLCFPDYQGTASGDSPIQVKECYILDKYLLASFLYNNKQYYCLYSNETGNVVAGYFNIDSGRPFYPMFQTANSVLGLFHKDDLDGLPNWSPQSMYNADLILFDYHFEN